MFLTRKHLYILIHISFWLFFVLFFREVFDIRIRWRLEEGVTADPKHPEVITFQFDIIKSLLVGLGFKLFLFYSNNFLLKRYSQRKKLLEYIIELILVVSACYTLELIVKNFINHDIKALNLPDINDFIAYFARINIVFYILILGFSFIYFFINEWIRNERIKNNLRAEQLAAELKLLKSQINPHFFFNTLNNLYALAQDKNNTELATALHTLADLMRYIVYESNEKFVDVEKEVCYINDYLKIIELRRSKSDNVTINFSVKGDIQNKKIAPMLMIPFIENAYKHGIDFKKQSFIYITLTIVDSQLCFVITNSNYQKEKNEEDGSSGLGLKNVYKRLELIYPSKYKLQIKSTQLAYEMKLTLPV